MKIYHNPRCRKSREALALLESKGIEPEVIRYLETPLSAAELKALLKSLDLSAEALIRKNEAIFKSEFKGKTLTEEEWIEAMVQYPKLMERPIVVKGKKAVVGRPPEEVLKLL